MYNDHCGDHDCFDCAHCMDVGIVYVCLAHRIQIVPRNGLACGKWVWDANENIPNGSTEKQDA